MKTLAPILMKGILAASLVSGLAACSGSDFSGSNSKKSLGIGTGADGDDHRGDTDAADVGDSDGDDSSDGGKDGGYDASDGVDGVDGADGDIDADGGGGGVDSSDSNGGGGLDTADGTGGGDVGLDGGEFNAKLRDPLSIKSLSADNNVKVTVQYKKKDGSWSAERSVAIPEGSQGTFKIEGVCRKKDNGTGEMNLKVNLQDKKYSYSSTVEAARRTAGSGSMVQITADMDGCGLGACIDIGQDNTMEFSCPKFLMKIDGF